MADDILPMEMSVARTATRGHDQKNTYIRDLQLHPDILGEIQNIDDGDYLKITANHEDFDLSIYGKVEPRNDDTHESGLDENTIGLGGPERDGLAIQPGETKVELDHVGFDSVSISRNILNSILGVRAITGRVRKAVNVDAGSNVCRIRS
ncbi:MAG: hypothetical protein ABEI86_05090, partial [Halobacteriaceae archaeon]